MAKRRKKVKSGKCGNCGNKYSYKEGSVIKPRGCIFSGQIGKKGIIINDGQTQKDPPFESYKNVRITCRNCLEPVLDLK